MDASTIFVDTNIPIYAAGKPHALKRPCARILSAIGHASGTFVTSALVLAELFIVERRRGRSGVLESFAVVMGDRVLPSTGEDMRLATELFNPALDTGLDPSDLIFVAVMQRHGIARIATANRAFDAVAGITRLDPARLAEWEDPAWYG
jgi:uncharacterized protein